MNPSASLLWMIAPIALSILQGAISWLVFYEEALFEIILGWEIVFTDHGIRRIIEKRGLFGKAPKYFLYCFLLNGIRAGLFLSTVVYFISRTDIQNVPFVCNVFVTYFIFLAYVVLNLHFTRIPHPA